MSPLISVVTVCYNAEEFIRECIESVIVQDFSDWEYVIVDGGSNDQTPTIIEQYQEHLAYWHSKRDRGLAHAFNLGLAQIRGSWIVFLNSDDFFADPTVLRQIAPYLKTNMDADVVYGQIELVKRENNPRYIGGPYGQAFDWQVFRRKDVLPHPAAFTNKAYFQKFGYFSEDYRIAVDYEHFLRAGSALRACFVPVLVAKMRDDGLSKKNVRASMQEGRKAQIATGALSPLQATLLCEYYRIRGILGQTARRFINVLK